MATIVPTILSDGQPLDPSIAIHTLEVRKELNRVPEARLVLGDGSVSARRFALSNTALLAPGKRVQILLRRDAEPDQQVFSGLVVRHAVEAHASGTRLRVELRDAALKLCRTRRTAVFRDRQDAAVARDIISGADLTVGTVDATNVQHRELVQYNATDWDFLLSRADVNGQVVVVDDGTVSLRDLSKRPPARLRVEFGLDAIHELELELDGGSQWGAVESRAWDSATQAASDPAQGTPLTPAAGNLDIDAVAAAIGGQRLELMTPAPLAADELAAWASARLARSRLAALRGRLVLDGRGDVAPFDGLQLGGVGDRFDGEHLISGVRHSVDTDGWRTELQLGVQPEWFARSPELADLPAGGLLPPASGLHIGRVDSFCDDPDGARRIKVLLPAFTAEHGAVWARVARPDAGPGRGFMFWPEPGDEVVVGFLADDPRHAVVLGALHGSVHAPPPTGEGPSDGNNKRAIVSRAGTTIAFDDEKSVLTIQTAKNNKIVLDDDAETITITDAGGSTITLDADGITLKSASAFTASDASGNTITLDDQGVTLKSAGDFTVDAGGSVTIKGSAVDIQ